MDTPQRYQRARQRVQALKGFYIHLTIYILVNAGLLLLNLLSSPGTLWFYWPLLGWGIGLAAHTAAVFGVAGWLGKDWEERQMSKFLEQED
jgi:asparagine N-glycosylation enzyme membrane subunit Stt3